MAAALIVEQPLLHPWLLLRLLPAAAGGSGELKCGFSCGTVNLFQTEESPACHFAASDHVHATSGSDFGITGLHAHTYTQCEHIQKKNPTGLRLQVLLFL